MAQAAAGTPAKESFAALLDESLGTDDSLEGKVLRGIDVGLKSEGRVALKEFAEAGQMPELKAGDEVEVYVERLENKNGEAVLSREKAKREEAWNQLERAFNEQERVKGAIFGRVKGGFTVDLGGAVAFLPGSQVDIRPVRDVSPLNKAEPFQILKMDRSRGNIVVSRRRARGEPRRAARRAGGQPEGGPGARRRGQEHHRLRRLRRSRRPRRPAARHRHLLEAHQPPDRGAVVGQQVQVQVIRFNARPSASASA
jgi:small subunit ribosomal protein S1